jgi:hypothetical protein
MGYPDGSLPARRTYPFDLSPGKYEAFWGGKDPIAADQENRVAWYHDAPDPGAFGDADLSDYESFWDGPVPPPSTEGWLRRARARFLSLPLSLSFCFFRVSQSLCLSVYLSICLSVSAPPLILSVF